MTLNIPTHFARVFQAGYHSCRSQPKEPSCCVQDVRHAMTPPLVTVLGQFNRDCCLLWPRIPLTPLHSTLHDFKKMEM